MERGSDAGWKGEKTRVLKFGFEVELGIN